ncbi:MAG: EVE domain-containing protein [Chloroflexi bacterium]|nr:EVE domain-containing protein [Chloroflexota bacterium]
MAYFLDLFTPETWQQFRENGAGVTGFRVRHQRMANERVKPGDLFICYLTRLSRWCGVLRVESSAYIDDSPIYGAPDPFVVRFKVKPVVALDPEYAIPIHSDEVWGELTMTREHAKNHPGWTGFFRGSLNRFTQPDGAFLVDLLSRQKDDLKSYPFSAKDKRHLRTQRTVRTLVGEVEVEVPDREDDNGDAPSDSKVESPSAPEVRESIRVQAKVAQIGAAMGFHIWVPRNDKVKVLGEVPETAHEKFLDSLPLNYDDTTLRTVEQIDVIWLKGRSMARAFEIEHTTAIYSGLLRMADLLALQPNMDIRLHIVAPTDKRERVLREIRRPVFSLLERGPLYDQCSYMSYESIESLIAMPHLSYMSDSIIVEYEESAEV